MGLLRTDVSRVEIERVLLSEERGWRLHEISPVWYQRPEVRAATGGGAWTMAWWCVAEAV